MFTADSFGRPLLFCLGQAGCLRLSGKLIIRLFCPRIYESQEEWETLASTASPGSLQAHFPALPRELSFLGPEFPFCTMKVALRTVVGLSAPTLDAFGFRAPCRQRRETLLPGQGPEPSFGPDSRAQVQLPPPKTRSPSWRRAPPEPANSGRVRPGGSKTGDRAAQTALEGARVGSLSPLRVSSACRWHLSFSSWNERADSLSLLPREEIQTQQRRDLSITRRKAKEVHGQERMELASVLEPWEVLPTQPPEDF